MKPYTKKKLTKVLLIILIPLIIIGLAVLLANWKIPHDTKDYVHNNTDSIPAQKAALVLGAARYIGGRQNLYFTYRIRAAKELYDAGKVKAFVVSGDNSTKDYNEAQDMYDALVEAGVPGDIIYMDYAGLRTLDSVVRMSEIFGQKSFIIVSQEFHNERAVFLAQYYGLEAYGYNAKDTDLNRFSYRTKIRELFARVKVFVDIITGKGPKHLGEPININ
ncbi:MULTISPECIES: ElyC/SanA/YdcF family protein [unclassified Dysgonomonas]|uniref:SanA/YdcF family protein n=1 Tax=unclassified Dysgonomonas TaxID=2630389 RepID=UPI0025C36DE7|nr:MULTISPECIES: ElyC/SanA/YdcF family protein [unclassified Dysgonomonas]HMM04882.1 ElyC/SanA/YdcF family protein [Dysgonomonas sp.]